MCLTTRGKHKLGKYYTDRRPEQSMKSDKRRMRRKKRRNKEEEVEVCS